MVELNVLSVGDGDARKVAFDYVTLALSPIRNVRSESARSVRRIISFTTSQLKDDLSRSELWVPSIMENQYVYLLK